MPVNIMARLKQENFTDFWIGYAWIVYQLLASSEARTDTLRD